MSTIDESLDSLNTLIKTSHDDLAGMPLDDQRHEIALNTLERLHAVRRADVTTSAASLETITSVEEKKLDGITRRETAVKPPIDRNAIVGAAASLGGIFMIISAERSAVIASKAIGFVGKTMTRII